MTSKPFTQPEKATVEALLSRHPHLMSASEVYGATWDAERVSYDQTFRALRNLVERGTVVKPCRGAYRLATENDR